MSKSQGRVTLPAQAGYMKESLELLSRWGADAIRDCDGTELPPELKKTGAKIYSTYFVARGHNEFIKENMGECQQIYLMSKFQTARENKVAIPFMAGYFKEQIKPDYDHDPKKWWEVIDRTGGEVVDAKNWEVNKADETVVVHGAVPFHEYTVTFLAYVIWDPTQMYNHLTNNWGDVEHDIPFDVRKPKSRQFIHDYLDKWLAENEETDVVRFTTFFYHFTLVFNEEAREKYVDWFGYSASVSVEALEAFEEEKGYRLRPEDIVTAGYHNNPFICPTPKFRDFLDFQQKFVAQEAKKLVKKVQRAGKEAMMFLGDNWIGIEPYGKYFPQIGLDAVVGSVGGGTTLRMISEIPAVKYTEARFLPYFFPDTFREGNNPVVEAKSNWLAARRAILRKPVDRIGYGGYLSLAYKFPKFVSYVEKVADEFREIYENIAGQTPYTGLKVAVLNAWGRLRSWQAHMVAHAIPYKQTYTYAGVLEALSGSSVDVSFLSFDDILEEGIPSDVDVIINAGLRDTAFSGGAAWRDQKLLRLLREWIDQGGGFIGIGEPTAHHHQGRFFQLAEALGVDKELGFTLNTNKYFWDLTEQHFITEDSIFGFDYGEGSKDVYAISEKTQILDGGDGEIYLAANTYGRGKTAYIAGLPFNNSNTRLLLRAMYYAAGKEAELKKWFAENIFVEVHAYPKAGKYAVVNNSDEIQTSAVYNGAGEKEEVTLQAGEIRWFKMQ